MIPGFTTWVNELINITVVEGMFLTPNEFVLDIPQLMGQPPAPPPASSDSKKEEIKS